MDMIFQINMFALPTYVYLKRVFKVPNYIVITLFAAFEMFLIKLFIAHSPYL